MQNRYDDAEAAPFEGDPLALRAYTSRLLGAEPGLVLHGGGNTSVKVRTTDFYGDEVELLYIKGSGHDLKTIGKNGFAPVRMAPLLRLAERASLSDTDMVRELRAAMTEPDAPRPSIETIPHALFPFPWVDHTHADAVVAVSNTPDGTARLRSLYGERVILVPYVMPGFVLSHAVRDALAGRDLAAVEGMILEHHGVITWGETAKESYSRMIALVSDAERYLAAEGANERIARAVPGDDVVGLAALRRAVGRAFGGAVVARLDHRMESAGFASRDDAAAIATRGPVTPDHVIRTKRVPVVLAAGGDADEAVAAYVEDYRAYFGRNDDGANTQLDPAPRWALWQGHGVVAFGASAKDADITADIARHTAVCIQQAEALGGWTPLGERELFEMEYWELEQAKLKKGGAKAPLAGHVALVTGAASGIGAACVTRLREMGCAVAALDIDRGIAARFEGRDVIGIPCDVTDSEQVTAAIEACVRAFGGLDLLVSNAGTFPPSAPIAELDDRRWRATLDLNLDAHHRVLRAAIPYLSRGFDPAVVFVASKNVAAPGAGVAAYSVAKAGMTQLARVAAIELAEQGVRVNLVHPDAVFDTGLWDETKIASRAASYGLTAEVYKTRNLLHREVRSADVANVVARLLSPEWHATTGAQVPIDGGNVRVI